jgi:hypothetical protein
MRSILLAASSLLVVSALAGCNARETAPTPAPAPPGSVGTGAPLDPQRATPPVAAMVVWKGEAAGLRTVGVVVEDGSAPPLTLSAAGVDTVFVKVIAGRRALLAEHGHDKSIRALVAASAVNGERAVLGTFAAGEYSEVASAQASDDTLVVELKRAGGFTNDVIALRAGAAPVVLAKGGKLVAAAGGRAAVLAGGDLHSVKLDASAKVTLGGGDGHDEVAEVQGDKILVTTHAGGDVRLVGIDGAGAIDLGKPGVPESAVGLTAQRIVYLRHAEGGAMLVSAARDGKDEQVLTAAELGAKPIQITAGGDVLFSSAAGALLAVGSAGGAAARVLDATAGSNVKVGAVHEGQLVYTCDQPHWPALRVARLDGSGMVSLLEEAPSLPFFGGVLPGGRVVYYRSLAGQLEGGRVFSIQLDGSDRRALATAVAGTNGQALGSLPQDQDFEAITPAGRLILESEFEVTGGGSQLLVGSGESEQARLLSGASHVRFAALVP